MAGRLTLVTGAAGFVGRALAGALYAGLGPEDRLLLSDAAACPEPWLTDDSRVRWLEGDIANPGLLVDLFREPIDALAHLAGVVSGAAEANFERGMRINLDATRSIFEACARQGQAGHVPRVIYASSIAVHGVPLPARLDDDTPASPSLSYGVQKLVGELLLTELSRRRWVDGLSLRLSGVVVRPALPNGALSGFNSDLIRETLAGRAVSAPVSPDAVIWLQSLTSAVMAIQKVLAASGPAPDGARVVQLPSVAASINEILAVITRISGHDARALVHFKPDPAIEPMFGRWPRDCSFRRARAMNLPEDGSLESLIRQAASASESRS